MASRLIWITGAHGLIGSHLVNTAAAFAPDNTVRGLTRDDCDLTDFRAVQSEFRRDQPQLIIHCAALSRSPDCQAQPAVARKINVDATACLAELASDIPFIFFSSDLIFDGQRGNYDESAEPNPLSVYAETKVAAEAVVRVNPKHTIIRTSLNGGVSPAGDRAFNEELRRAWQSGQTVRLFTDEFRSPIAASVTARAVWELIRANRPGLYHVAGSERLSRWQIGQLVAARCPELNPRLEPASLMEYRGAPRSPDTSLDCRRVQALLSFPLPRFSEWLASHRGRTTGGCWV